MWHKTTCQQQQYLHLDNGKTKKMREMDTSRSRWWLWVKDVKKMKKWRKERDVTVLIIFRDINTMIHGCLFVSQNFDFQSEYRMEEKNKWSKKGGIKEKV